MNDFKRKPLSNAARHALAAKKKQKDAQIFYEKIIKPRMKDKKIHPNITVINDGDHDEDDFL